MAAFPTSRGQVQPAFAAFVRGLADQAAAQARSDRAGGLRPYNQPAGLGSTLDPPGMVGPFDRAAADAAYAAVVADGARPGTIGDAVSLQAQAAYLAAAERALRARLCTPPRLLAMACARRAGHGDPGGVFRGVALKYATDALKAGQPQ